MLQLFFNLKSKNHRLFVNNKMFQIQYKICKSSSHKFFVNNNKNKVKMIINFYFEINQTSNQAFY